MFWVKLRFRYYLIRQILRNSSFILLTFTDTSCKFSVYNWSNKPVTADCSKMLRRTLASWFHKRRNSEPKESSQNEAD